MKKLIKRALFLAFLGTVMVGCEKDAISENSIADETVASEQKTKLNNSKANEATTAAIKVSCTGSCTGTEEVCGMRIQGMPVEYVECDCEGCSMTFSSIGNIPSDQTLSDNFEYVAANADSYFDDNYPNQTIVIASVEFYENSNGSVVIQINYEDDGGTFDNVLTYILDFNASGEMTKKQEIDCSGGCDNEGETCRERYYPSSGGVECTCEGDCSMTVTHVPE